MRYAPNGNYILVSTLDHQMNLYPVYAKAPKYGAGALKVFTGHVNSRFNLQSTIFTVTGGPNYIVQGSEDNLVYIWDAANQTVLQTLEGHSDVPLAVACNPSEEMMQFASAGRDGYVKLWELC